ncbi:MAG: MFS transporter [Hyphomonadaceae bacterium]
MSVAGESVKQKPAPGVTTVVVASTAGTAFEWYDFFLFVPLAGILSKAFFSGLTETQGYIFALGAFAVGFAFRPLGALIFGRIGDRVGRKGTFLITMALMGLSTFAMGLLPTYAQGGFTAPVLFIGLRILQGMALGGEWGGAAIYIVEHSPTHRRGEMGSWLGGSAAFGLGGALLMVLGTRLSVGEAAFAEWGWRVPFLASAFLLAISIWIRLRLHESPVFKKLAEEGRRSQRPYVESFARWPILKRVFTVLFGIMVAQGAVWYTCFFYAPFFLENVIKVAAATVNEVMIALVAVSVPLYWIAGVLSDKIGRKPVMIFGMVTTVVWLFPGFHLLSHFGNPTLAEASARAPIVVAADPAECSLQFDPVGKSNFRSSCDIAKSTLARLGVSYANERAEPGAVAHVRVGETIIPSVDARALSGDALNVARAAASAQITAAVRAAGYPAHADPARTNPFGLFATLLVFCIGATFLFGPQASALVELFPANIRYTALSLPYHIGTGWVGGFLPATAFALVAASGDIYFGLWYPLIAAGLSALTAFLALPETRGRELDY